MFVGVSCSLFPVRAQSLEILRKTKVLVIDHFFLDNLVVFNRMLTSIHLLYLIVLGNGGCDDRKNNERKKGLLERIHQLSGHGRFSGGPGRRGCNRHSDLHLDAVTLRSQVPQIVVGDQNQRKLS